MMIHSRETQYWLFGLFFFGLVTVVYSEPGTQAGSRYNLIKDSGFEENSSLWVEFKNTEETTVSRHAPGGYEKSSGLIDLMKGLDMAPPQLLRFAYLSQEVSKRAVSEIDSLCWFIKFLPAQIETTDAPYWFGVVVSGYAPPFGMCELRYFYKSQEAQIPVETEKEKNIELTLPEKEKYYEEKRDLREDWQRKGFSPQAEIIKIKLIAGSMMEPADARAGGFGQTVWWDNLKLLSTRFDHDVAPVQVLSGNKIKLGRSYVPKALVKNVGVFNETFKVACAIFKSGVKVYSDTAVSIMLKNVPVDETREVEFKRWVPREEGSYSIRLTTIFNGDQNPGNDSFEENLIFVKE